MKFILVNGRKPRLPSFCAACCEPYPRQLRARDRNTLNLLRLRLLLLCERSNDSKPCEGIMKMLCTQLDTCATVLLLQCDGVAPSESEITEPGAQISYYNIAVAGRGRINLRTGLFDQRTATYRKSGRFW